MSSEDMCRKLADALVSKHLTISCAESLTGGLIGSAITAFPGSSAYFMGSAVTYSNESKEEILGIPLGLVWEYGAVSEAVAIQMARSARRIYSSDIAVSCTGIAGPGGATETKPVGLVYIGVSSSKGERAFRYVFEGSRDDVRERTVEEALRIALGEVSSL